MPTEQRIAVGANTDSLAGTYRVTFVATSGRRSGKSASGVLVLQAHDSAGQYLYTYHFTQRNPYVTEPYYGYTTIAPDSIAATPNGSVDSRDSVMPGVALQVSHRPPPNDNDAPALTLFFGQGTTRRDQMTLDGPYFFARILALEADGFRGTWYSEIGPTTIHAGGYFCAERAP